MKNYSCQLEVLQQTMPRDEALRRVVKAAMGDPAPGALVCSAADVSKLRDALNKPDLFPKDSAMPEDERLITWLGKVAAAVRRVESPDAPTPPANRREPIRKAVAALLDEFLKDYPFAPKVDRPAIVSEIVKIVYAEVGQPTGTVPTGKPGRAENVTLSLRRQQAAVAAMNRVLGDSPAILSGSGLGPFVPID